MYQNALALSSQREKERLCRGTLTSSSAIVDDLNVLGGGPAGAGIVFPRETPLASASIGKKETTEI